MDTIGPLTFNAVVSGSPPQHQHEHHGAGASGSTCACSLSEEGAPIIAPLDTLEQVFSWQPCSDGMCVPSISLRPRCDHQGGSKMDDPTAQKMIVCHDMMGGYIKDKYIQGHSDLNDYYFYQWQYIDAFIYFSHHFITLPPPTWTNIAHKNGVLVMGTIITEWTPGAQLCTQLFSEDWRVAQFCDQLVAMAAHYKIDGWLVNIENPIHPKLMDRLHMLLSLLTTGMHSACPGSKVIWYDSVTIEGNLTWQNTLNHLNQVFFDLCDGIFLNYNWSEDGLSSSGSVAGDRRGDVYVGVDVFGRGCFGGGGFNSCKAVEVISRQALSSALFAPGWVYETQAKSHFFQNQERFWSLLSEWVGSGRVSCLPLVSAFGRGYGESVNIDGKMVHSECWTHHSVQDIQPSVTSLSSLVTSDPMNGVRIERVLLDMQTVYNNGSSLRLEGTVRHTPGLNKPALARLFQTHLKVVSPLLVGLTFTCDPTTSLKLYLQLHTSSSSRVFLDLLMEPPPGKEGTVPVPLPPSSRVPHLPGCVLAPLPRPHAQHLHRLFTGEPQPPHPWTTKYYIIDPADVQSCVIQELSLGVYYAGRPPPISHAPSGASHTPQPFSLVLGEIKEILTLDLRNSSYDS
ncbi:cytosolic endo-beta-N-acetylglucosaminidase-like isoform X3 [Halichondria panicea]|uniref:cytosolic endo-beta-N-acetylglucosaminidase-like isoform X3 n=1 Tax=Halichondria panicea TaxID=6063 RepID=UPI00312B604B